MKLKLRNLCNLDFEIMASIMLISLFLLVAVQVVDSLSIMKDTKGKFSSYRITKLKDFFDVFDVDEDGVLTEHEYVVLTTERAQNVLLSWRAMAVNGIFSNAFRVWWSNKYSNYKTAFTFKDMIRVHEIDLPISTEELAEGSWDLFGTFDIDCDGKLAIDEYSKFLFVFRNTAEIQPIFDAIDQNANGVLDAEEFVSAYDLHWYRQEFSTTDVIIGKRY
ncbi:sarcoplasmic calcium-binding protein-like [Lingula anatina]|uniref:Sarcoplasmic calcium-binding protein-like n=1 Tax=Lingula anatina TaxID=7574 RepID=A0A1S3HLF0_LINAN|nr:sarcoplasmic calcium-binding protein-like [Lingula anatina]|eukprot:XP_013386928.1 sarcoplasmic calcium-binding protein-like [Lingula anatina]